MQGTGSTEGRPGSDLYEHSRFRPQGGDHSWAENEQFLYPSTWIKGDGNLMSSLAVSPCSLDWANHLLSIPE